MRGEGGHLVVAVVEAGSCEGTTSRVICGDNINSVLVK